MSLMNEMQSKLKVPKSRLGHNRRYKYRNLDDIFDAVKPLIDTGTLVISDEIIVLGEASAHPRFYVKATAVFADGDQTYTATGVAREMEKHPGMDEPQITGTASSYARKAALGGLFLLDDNEDADDPRANSKTPEADPLAVPPKSKPPPANKPAPSQGGNPATTKQLDAISETCKRKGLDVNKYIKPDLTNEEARQIITDLNRR